MITNRQSPSRVRNAAVVERPSGGSNAAWVAKRAARGTVLLLGGSGVIDFRVRVAQSHLRRDLLPSFWSMAGLMVSPASFLTVPLDAQLDVERVPSMNAVHECRTADYEADRFPNVAVLTFASHADPVVDYARGLASQRGAIDLPAMLVAWLAFVWGAGDAGNPLLGGVGVPGSGLVESAFGIAGIELTPGIASTASCPEAIWQAAIWWHDYYRQTAAAVADRPRPRDRRAVLPSPPSGFYLLRQPAAAVVETPSRTSNGPRRAVSRKTRDGRTRPKSS